jgi:catechol 2,3-dioxygenase-like lactoylglutathione lyase family enzyme
VIVTSGADPEGVTMPAEPIATYTFTKLVVDDLDAMCDYYCHVFGLRPGTRERFDDGVGGEPIDEVALVANPEDPFGAVSLLKFEDRAAARPGEVILGFTTPDLSALRDRVERAGGTLVGKVKEMPSHKIRVAFARDPEGHLCELVELQP